LTLTGHLEPLAKDQAHLYTQTTTRRAPLIEIKDVRMFSYGQFEDRKIGLWAGGKAGWYALKLPSRAYKEIWTNMVLSVDTFYWVVDSYREKRRKGNKKNGQILPDFTAEEIFDKYAEEELKDATLRDYAAKTMYEQRHFLLASMLAGKEGIAWGRNPLYKHLSKRFPEDHDLLKSRLTGHALPARNDRQKSASVEAAISNASVESLRKALLRRLCQHARIQWWTLPRRQVRESKLEVQLQDAHDEDRESHPAQTHPGSRPRRLERFFSTATMSKCTGP
jgi:hypothetical protein